MAKPLKPPDNIGIRAILLREIRSPLTFFVLAVLILESLLSVLVVKATGSDFTALVYGVVGTLFLLIGVVAFLAYRSPERLVRERLLIQETSERHECFLSSPMYAYQNDEKYQENRVQVLKLIEAFRKDCKFRSVFYAGNEISSMGNFEARDISALDDIQGVRESKYFVLYYPDKIVSSALFEAGVALAFRKPSIYFVRSRKDLPFLMQQAEMAFRYVKIYECPTVEEIVNLISIHREKLFPALPDASA